MLVDLAAALTHRQPDHDPVVARPPALPGFAVNCLRRRDKRLRKLGRRLGELDAPHLHALRIRAKRLRYALEFLADLWPARLTRPYIAALRDLQNVTGRIQDSYVAETQLDELAGMALSPQKAVIRRLLHTLSARRRNLRKKAEGAWGRLVARKRVAMAALTACGADRRPFRSGTPTPLRAAISSFAEYWAAGGTSSASTP